MPDRAQLLEQRVKLQFQRAIGTASDRSAPAQQIHNNHYQGDDQQQVNQATSYMQTETQ
jgi:hypothetical protein